MIHEALILAGGKGTRLKDVAPGVPKPLLPVAGRAFIEWLIISLRSRGCSRVVLSVGYRAEQIVDHFSGVDLGLEMVISPEDTPLGTGGALRLALPHLEGNRFLVLNGDSICPFSIQKMEEVHTRHQARATLWLVGVPDASRFGEVVADPDGRVLAFREKKARPCCAKPRFISAGVYVVERVWAQSIPRQRSISLETELFPLLINDGLWSVSGKGPFLDIGTPESLARADDFLARNWPELTEIPEV